ncbi:MAG TPA: type II/IV secretion system protein, partial [Aquificae bacterium]|nr:type II/IV secretion system protein [Aquificota bacterium]
IHINPLSNVSFLFLRIDGILQPTAVIPYSLHGNVVSKIKLMANMNVAERRIPQDGSFSYSSLGQKVDVRVSTLPTAFGEKVVMRVLKKDISKLNLDFLGFLPMQKELLKKAVNLSYGMLLTSGPTGSGKSTTLYSLLRSINYLKRNVVTVEDPIEYRFNFIYQTEINTAIGYKFSTALKYFMRQDPDVILVGEIRDKETANTSVEAANTGHLLLSTIHANCAITTVQRLLNLVEDKDVALSVLKVISAQRLLRKLCPFCKQEAKEDLELLKKKYPKIFDLIDFEPKVYRAKGCERCGNRGYIGRTVLAEVLELDDDLINLFYKNTSLIDIKKKLEERNFLDMPKVATYKILSGETDINEVKRVLEINYV